MSFSMQEAIDYALKNNFNAKEAENNIAAAKKENGKQQLWVCHKLMLK